VAGFDVEGRIAAEDGAAVLREGVRLHHRRQASIE